MAGKWQGATVGRDSKTMGIRLTEEEEERLEQLRGDLRLTSKGQVIRAALDLLEQLAVVSDRMTGQDPEGSRRAGRRLRRHHGVPRLMDVEAAPTDDAIAKRRKVVTSYKHVVSGPGDDAGSSGAAPDADHMQGEDGDLKESSSSARAEFPGGSGAVAPE